MRTFNLIVIKVCNFYIKILFMNIELFHDDGARYFTYNSKCVTLYFISYWHIWVF